MDRFIVVLLDGAHNPNGNLKSNMDRFIAKPNFYLIFVTPKFKIQYG